MAKWGFDLAFHPALPTYTAILAANGAAFVGRYLSWLPNSKCIDRAEYDALVAAGVDVVLNWEYDGHAEILAGYYSGQKAAGEAVRQARLLGHPAGAAIYFSCDWHITDPAQARGFFQGARSAIAEYRVGIYGDYAVVDALLADGTCDYGWQTYGWSVGRLSGRAHLYQYQNGVNVSGMWVDRDRTLRADFGSRDCALGAGPTPAPAPTPAPDHLAYRPHLEGDTTMPVLVFKDPNGALFVQLTNGYKIGLGDANYEKWALSKTGQQVPLKLNSNQCGAIPALPA